ncbi:MAG: exodeoxyribonuclease III [Syntrophobacteraceae bacterium]
MKWKIATFNVNGIRSREHVVVSWLEQNRPDVLCLQEIKCQDAEFPRGSLLEAGYEASVCGQKSFHGVAILSVRKPEEVRYGFGDGGLDTEARLIAAKIDGIWIFNTYVPQGRSPDHPAFQTKLDFFARLKNLFSSQYRPSDPIIWTGDINVAPEEIDVFAPRRMDGKIGFHPMERRALADVVSWGFIDLFRKHHPDARQFTFWDYRLPESFDRNLGWRLDHIRATEPIAKASIDCQVDAGLRSRPSPSDHTPIWAELELG